MAKTNTTQKTGRPRTVDDAATKKQVAEAEVTAAVGLTEEEIALAAPTADFANGRQLAKAIAQKCDLVAVGSKLLRDGEAKGASVRARMFETTVEYLYGKPAANPTPEAAQVIFVCDIPRPAREKKVPEQAVPPSE